MPPMPKGPPPPALPHTEVPRLVDLAVSAAARCLDLFDLASPAWAALPPALLPRIAAAGDAEQLMSLEAASGGDLSPCWQALYLRR